MGEALRIRVTAPPERGKANAAVEAMLARALGVSRKCVTVSSGHASPRKVVEIEGLPEAEVYRRLAGKPAPNNGV